MIINYNKLNYSTCPIFLCPNRSRWFQFHPPSLPCCLYLTDSASMAFKAFDKCSRSPGGCPPPPSLSVLKASPKAADAVESKRLTRIMQGQGTWIGGLGALSKTIGILSLKKVPGDIDFLKEKNDFWNW